ncbi:arylsulfotransferase family protein [Phytoactinopolyspora endophytica]|uniref:arylsulfotransferase family protein n=1 Tax=Phytoactinopolyspora endophytica TaxID=1642495 RepID=UPI0013EB4D01|nr:arylsulfotransferase family protein [Phytoactinopolyspora endophytica]
MVVIGAVALVMTACGDDGETTSDDDESVESQSFVTRPDLTPPLIGVETSGETADGYLFMAPKKAEAQTGALIVDDDGEVIWSLPREDMNVADFRVQEYRGQPVLTWWEGESHEGHGSGEFVIMDSSYQEVARIGAGNDRAGDLHDFELTDDGTALVLAYETEPADLTPFGGDEDGEMLNNYVQEIDVETGEVLLEWDASEHVPMSDTYDELGGDDDEEEDDEDAPFDWFHVNSVAEDDDGGLLVSARNTHAVYYLDRETGDVRWILGGKSSDFAMDEETTFTWQHDARWTESGELSLFDNQALPKTADESRAIVLELDEEAGTVDLVEERTNPEPILAGSQGNTQMLDGGGVFVGWGSGSSMTEFDADGEAVMQATLEPAESYRAFRMPWEGTPATPPDVTVEGTDDGQIDVYMSWNGATEVDQWRLLGGEAEDALEPVETVGRDGFETLAQVDDVDFIAVEALDSSGAVIGTSDVVSTD